MKLRIYKQGTWNVAVSSTIDFSDVVVVKFWDYDDAIKYAIGYIRRNSAPINADRMAISRSMGVDLFKRA